MRRGSLMARGGVALAAVMVLGGANARRASREASRAEAPGAAGEGEAPRPGPRPAGPSRTGGCRWRRHHPVRQRHPLLARRERLRGREPLQRRGPGPHSIASVSFRRGGASGSFAIAAIFAVPVNTLGIGYATGLPPSTVGSMVFALPLQTPVISHSGSFLGGLTNNPCGGSTVLGAACNGPALTQGTMDPGMGFHAVRLYATGTNGVDVPNRNAIFRVTGDNLPVELMGFGAE